MTVGAIEVFLSRRHVRVQGNHPAIPESGVPVEGPKQLGDQALGRRCPACDEAFLPGDHTVLLPLGPGKSETQRERAQAGEPYMAIAVEVHLACTVGSDGDYRGR